MATNNYVSLTGRLGKDIEIKMAKDHKITQICMAIQNKNDVDWIYVNVWDSQAEYLERYAKKGSLVAINGKVKTSKYQDKDGKTHTQQQINATEVSILADWKDNKKASNEIIIEDEELPFY